MKEFDIFIPLYYNDGEAVEPKQLKALQQRLLDEFDGLTFFPQPNKGYWKMGDITYQDEIVIYRVLTAKPRKARRFLRQLKERLKKELDQEEILVIERDVDTL